MSDRPEAKVAIVGGGPAGAALAIRLAAAGRDTVLFERLPEPRWRASGVYSSALTRRRLHALGLTHDEVAALIRPVSAMVVRTADGRAECRLEYPAPYHACGLDRVRLERVLLDRARSAGARVVEGATVRQVRLGERAAGLFVSGPEGPAWWKAGLVVGADGPTSLVARAAGATIAVQRFRRAALTGHRVDDQAAPEGEPAESQMIIGRGWYLGIAPVPGRRVNLGLVLGENDLRRQLVSGADLERIVDGALRMASGPPRRLLDASPTDSICAHLPLVHRVRRAAGPGFLLVGDAAGFIDPLSGEGLHRALVSAELAETAIGRWARGDDFALTDYDRRLRARFRSKDLLSWLLQVFLFDPGLAAYALRRLDRRPEQRRLFARGMADLTAASALFDPRYLSRVLAP